MAKQHFYSRVPFRVSMFNRAQKMRSLQMQPVERREQDQDQSDDPADYHQDVRQIQTEE